jgi:MFS family permease
MGASGVGAVIGSMNVGKIAHPRRLAYLRGASTLVALAMSTLGLAHGLLLAIPAMIAMTLGTSTIFGMANTIVQERAPDHIRGRVSAIAGLSFFGVLPFAGLLTAKLADVAGMRVAMITGALCFGSGALLLFSRTGSLSSTPQPSVASAPESV